MGLKGFPKNAYSLASDFELNGPHKPSIVLVQCYINKSQTPTSVQLTDTSSLCQASLSLSNLVQCFSGLFNEGCSGLLECLLSASHWLWFPRWSTVLVQSSGTHNMQQHLHSHSF